MMYTTIKVVANIVIERLMQVSSDDLDVCPKKRTEEGTFLKEFHTTLATPQTNKVICKLK